MCLCFGSIQSCRKKLIYLSEELADEPADLSVGWGTVEPVDWTVCNGAPCFSKNSNRLKLTGSDKLVCVVESANCFLCVVRLSRFDPVAGRSFDSDHGEVRSVC